jgi:hypothetical protein
MVEQSKIFHNIIVINFMERNPCREINSGSTSKEISAIL